MPTIQGYMDGDTIYASLIDSPNNDSFLESQLSLEDVQGSEYVDLREAGYVAIRLSTGELYVVQSIDLD